MTIDAAWNGGMGTLGILDGEAKRKRINAEWRNAPRGSFKRRRNG